MSDESSEFTEDDIRRQLAALGYHDVPESRLKQFARDLQDLVQHDRSKASSEDQSFALAASRADASAAAQPAFLLRQPTRTNTSHRHDPVEQPGKENQATRNFPIGHDREQTRPKSYYERETRPTTAPARPAGYAHADSANDSRNESGFRVPKRKVLRKINGESRVFDESLTTESEADDVSELGERLAGLPINEEDSYLSEDDVSQYRRQRPHSAGLWPHRPSGDEESEYAPHLPRSFIRPAVRLPQNRRSVKTDPVNRFHFYNRQWGAQKAPGEKKHKDLRWNVRELMMQKDEVVQKPQRVYVPNGYIVPTNKKRQALRWEVRHDIARGVLPQY
ncbi:HYLS1 [Branchiostoma lanceolatum]|uniref:HYLS1 protein n=1 Tax=Branchiostoma lanceolatum TaxID=7740 RepID=A0A8J9ZU87_BRALA|nr:HYLS1 [Branchiostoma lanceolatum]